MDLYLIILITIVSMAAGFIGSFVLHKRMSLVADAFSHIALPGIGIALLINANPLYGGIMALAIGTIIVWILEEKSHLPTENIVGIIFIFALALGAVLMPEKDMIETLFGGAEKIGQNEFIISVILAFFSIFIMWLIKERITIISLSAELSQSLKIKRKLYNFLFLAVFSMTVILGLKFLGILLMGALIIIPAAIGKLFAWNQKSDIFLSQLFAVISVNTGLLLHKYYFLPLGPAIAIICFIIFIFSLGIKQIKSLK